MNLLANNPAKSFRLALVDTSLATKVIIANIFLILSAKISVPFYPVPLSLQTLAIMAIALFTNRKIAMVSTTLYLLEGLLGMPVFTTMESGPIVFLGTRGGYLLGFLLLSYVCSTS
ncbi:MAG: biotin transporter BioY [Legionellales bacterium]|nr:biotin transporter BioY [Legionellales bacterium]